MAKRTVHVWLNNEHSPEAVVYDFETHNGAIDFMLSYIGNKAVSYVVTHDERGNVIASINNHNVDIKA